MKPALNQKRHAEHGSHQSRLRFAPPALLGRLRRPRSTKPPPDDYWLARNGDWLSRRLMTRITPALEAWGILS